MGEFIDYYEILQVHPKADPEIIEKAYRTLVMKHHPDHGGDNGRMQLLNEAYETLRDPALRAAYNLDWGMANGGPAAYSRSGVRAMPSAEEAFRAYGWPPFEGFLEGFSSAWQPYVAWCALDGDSNARAGSVEDGRLAEGMLGFAISMVKSNKFQGDELVRLLSLSFSEAQGTFSFDQALASVLLLELPAVGSPEFPPAIEHAWREWSQAGPVAAQAQGDHFTRLLAAYLYFVSKYHPEWVTTLCAEAARRFSRVPIQNDLALLAHNVYSSKPFHKNKKLEALLQVAGSPFNQLAWSRWADEYSSRRGSVRGPGAASVAGAAASLLLGIAIGSVFDN